MSSCVGCVEFGELGSGERRRIGGSVWAKGGSGRVRGEDEVVGRGWGLRIMLDDSMKVTTCQ